MLREENVVNGLEAEPLSERNTTALDNFNETKSL